MWRHREGSGIKKLHIAVGVCKQKLQNLSWRHHREIVDSLGNDAVRSCKSMQTRRASRLNKGHYVLKGVL